MTYRDFQIPKKNGFRLISAPDPELLHAQKQLLPELNEALTVLATEYKVNDIIHGFRYKHNCVTAARLHRNYTTTLSMDISNFFNSVKREHFDYTGMTLPETVFHKDGYTAQGFATSPILANIAIIPALKEIQDYLVRLDIMHVFTIYADDLQISTDIADAEFQIFFIAKVITDILQKHQFSVNPHKTRIAYAKYGYRRILGLNVSNHAVLPTRKIRRKMRAAKHQKNGPSLGGLTNWSLCKLPKALQ